MAITRALLEDLSDRGLLQDTLVMMFGEFGRTPAINKQVGRDHWAQAMSIVLAGEPVRARALVKQLWQHFALTIHPRTIERAVAGKKTAR